MDRAAWSHAALPETTRRMCVERSLSFPPEGLAPGRRKVWKHGQAREIAEPAVTGRRAT